MEEKKRARIGFVGCGNHATSSLYPAIHLIPEFHLVAVCDLKQELAERNARIFGAEKWYTDVSRMLKEEKLDGAIVVGTPQMHCEVGKQCIDAGLPIFVEKPSAVSYKDALALAEYARKKGLWGSVAYMKRYSVCYNLVKTITEREEFGKISEVETRFSNGPYPSIWGIKENARAFLIGQVVHIFNLVRFFAGEVEEVYARLNSVTADRFGYAITAGFKSGAVGVMNLNALESTEWKVSERLAVSGYDCWVEVEDMIHLRYHPGIVPIPGFSPGGREQTIEWRPDWTELMATKAEGAFGYKGELENFARSCLGLDKPKADLFDGAKDLEIAEAVWESATTGRPVKVKGV